MRQEWQVRMYRRITLQINVLSDRINVVAGIGVGNLRFKLVCQCSTATLIPKLMSVDHGLLPISIARKLPSIFVRGYKAIRSSSRETEVQVFMPGCARYSNAIKASLVEIIPPPTCRPRPPLFEECRSELKAYFSSLNGLTQRTSKYLRSSRDWPFSNKSC